MHLYLIANPPFCRMRELEFTANQIPSICFLFFITSFLYSAVMGSWFFEHAYQNGFMTLPFGNCGFLEGKEWRLSRIALVVTRKKLHLDRRI